MAKSKRPCNAVRALQESEAVLLSTKGRPCDEYCFVTPLCFFEHPKSWRQCQALLSSIFVISCRREHAFIRICMRIFNSSTVVAI